jgi:hypothetical protein
MIPFFQGAAGGAPVASQVFAATIYSGNSGVQTVTTGINTSTPGGLVWVKTRVTASVLQNHILQDTIRGSTRQLRSNTTGAETTDSLAFSFGSTGFSINTSNSSVNETGAEYVAWSFARAARFFDVVTWTGTGVAQNIAHSLGMTPGMIIVKRRDTTGAWPVYHRANTGAPETDYLLLNTTDATADLDTYWNDTTPTASVFTVGTNADVNASGGTYVAYLFAHDTAGDGIVQCGSYTGNGSAAGPTVTLGWRPQFVMIKRAVGGTGNWAMFDATRGINNPGNDDKLLQANSIGDESTANAITRSLTGFQIVDTVSDYNTNGDTYIYLAIREA